MSWQRVRQEFEQICELPQDAVEARLAVLQSTDSWLASQVREMLQQDAARPGFLERVAPAPVPRAAAGVRLGRFELVRPLGSGGMGSVWEARQSDPERTVALKLVAWNGRADEERWRFRHEVQTLAQLGHPSIAALHEAGESDLDGVAVAWFAMELVPGARDVVSWVQEKALSRSERVQLFLQLAEAVEHGHRRGVLHRDLKPGNVLVSATGELKLIDFGVARALGDGERAMGRTQTGAILGTLQYMAPEQLRGETAAIGPAADVYSLGVLLYRLLCDRPPHDLDGVPFARIPAVVLEQEPVPPCVAQPDLPADLGWVVQRALAKDRAQRYPTVRELVADLQRWQRHEPVHAKAPSRLYRARKFVRRHRLAVATGAILVLGLGTGAGFLVHGLQAATAGERDAQRGARLARELARVTVGMFDAIDDTEASRDVRVHELLDKGKFAPGSLREPAVEFAVREVRGQVYARLRRFPEARFEFEQAAALLPHQVMVEAGDAYRREKEWQFAARFGRVLAAVGERERGERMVREAQAASVAASGAVRVEIAAQLCRLLVDAGANEEVWEEASALRELARQHADPTTVSRAEVMMADAACSLGRHDEAAELAEAVWQSNLQRFGEDAPETCSSLANHVRVLQEAGRLDEAEALYPGLVATTARIHGPVHDHTLVVTGNHATLLLMRGKREPALVALQEVVKQYEARGGAPSAEHLTMVGNLGMTLFQGAKFAAAEPHLRRAAELSRVVLDARDPTGPKIRFNHAACLGAMKRWDTAKPLLLAEYETLEGMLPQGHPELGKMRRTLADLHQRNGEPEAAAAWRAR